MTFSFSKRFVLFLLLLRQNNNFPSPNIFLLFCFCFPSLGQKKKTNFPSLLQTKYFISQDISSFPFFSHNSSFLPQIFSSVSSSIVFLRLPFFDRSTIFLSSPFPFIYNETSALHIFPTSREQRNIVQLCTSWILAAQFSGQKSWRFILNNFLVHSNREVVYI